MAEECKSRRLLRFGIVLGLCAASCIQAQETAGKIAVVNLQAALLSTREGKKAAQDLAGKVEPERKEFANRQEEISRLEDQLQKSSTVLSDDKKAEMEQTIDEKKKRLAREAQDADEEVQQQQQRILQTFGQRMISVVGKYAAEHHYALVLAVGSPGSPIIHWSGEEDITKPVAELFDQTPPPSGSK